MQFVRRNDCYRVVRITGPMHNLLGLRFASSGEGEGVGVEVVDISSDSQVARLKASDVAEAVGRGLDKANAAFATAYRPIRIEFVGSDTPAAAVYEELAYAIVERLVSGGGFR